MNYAEDKALKTLLDYANADDNIRAVMMQGSRAFGKVDKYSDYDIACVTKSNEPYLDSAILPFLVANFGEIAVMQTPDNGDPHDIYTHLVQFTSGIRIDLTFNSIAYLQRVPLDSDTVILMDKDGLLAGTPPPSDADYWIQKPSAEEFHMHCNEFWWCSVYVNKAIVRGQMLHALELFSKYVRNEYRAVLAYLAGAHHNWERVNVGKHGTNIRLLLPPDATHYFDTLLGSYVPADAAKILLALDTLMTSFNDLAATVAQALNYEYDSEEAAKTMQFIQVLFGDALAQYWNRPDFTFDELSEAHEQDAKKGKG
jgi:aminoglycoside 6-adenylyltransferase